MFSKKLSVQCLRDNKTRTVFYYNFCGINISNGCEFANGSKECEICKTAVENELNHPTSDNAP